MTDRPIIMTPENVRLLIREAGQPGTGKSETRRLLYIASAGPEESTLVDGYAPHASAPKGAHWRPSGWHRTEPGDRLWVREACANWDQSDLRWWREADDSRCSTYRKTTGPTRLRRASFHMPRIDSRLTLFVERVRIERLRDISESDAIAEGVSRPTWTWLSENPSPSADELAMVEEETSFRAGYELLWGSLHKSPNSWADNPWVVAISFRPTLGNIDSLAAAA